MKKKKIKPFRLKYKAQKMSKYDKIKFVLSVALFMLLMLTPMNAFASLGGYEYFDLYHDITVNVQETNDILNEAMKFASKSPFEYLNGNDSAVAVANASKALALVVATLFLCIDFFKKSVNFEWSRGWENIMLFAVKVIVVKVMVQNCDTIINNVYSAFNSVNDAITGSSGFKFLPYDEEKDMLTYIIKEPVEADGLLKKAFYWGAYKLGLGKFYEYKVSPSAVRLLHPKAFFPDATKEYNSIAEFADIMADKSPTIETPIFTKFMDMFYFLIMKGIACLITVQIIGRAFELSVYTLLAPLPLSTFASEGNCDVAKNFLKKYIACVLQITVIFAMFIAYTTLKIDLEGFMGFVALIALSMGVMKSGTWARSICGTQ